MRHGKETEFGRTFEIILSQYGTIILTTRFIELNSDPNALFEISWTDESHSTWFAIVNYMLADFLLGLIMQNL